MSRIETNGLTRYLDHAEIKRRLSFAARIAWAVQEVRTGIRPNIESGEHQRNEFASWAFGLVLEHQSAVVTLVETGHLGPAFALWRPTFEAFVRGLWLRVASKEEIKQYAVDRTDTKDPGRMLRTLMGGRSDRKTRYSNLRDIWRDAEKTLNGLTHHGYVSLLSRSGTVEADANSVVSLLLTTTQFAVFSTSEVLAMAEPTKEVVELRAAFFGTEAYLNHEADAFAASLAQGRSAPIVA